jgi:hypothetical protein
MAKFVIRIMIASNRWGWNALPSYAHVKRHSISLVAEYAVISNKKSKFIFSNFLKTSFPKK